MGNRQPARDLCRVKTEGGNYRGYKKDILTENLSERDNAVFVCPRCKGILRDLCISTDGEQFCSCCKKEGEQTYPNIHMNNMILCFKCSCPLMVRGCGWLGTLGDCEKHLDTCGYVQETCKLKCGVVLQRNDHVTHEKENCVQRIVECEHCEKDFKFCELPEHLDVCPKMKVSCELKCGVVMCRDEVEQHLEKECGLVEESCKLGCGAKLTRNELKVHVTDKCVKRLVTCEHCQKSFKFCELPEHLDMCPRMKVSCELECGMVMCRDEVAQHLKKECGQVIESCQLGCGAKLTRDELKVHVTDQCVQRLVTCEHCELSFKFCELSEHLDMCPRMKVSCELKCGTVMCREEVAQHIDRDCKEKEIECPFAKYKCVRLIKRQDLNTHLMEKETEHLKLKLDAIEDIVMKQSELIEILSGEIESLKTNVK